MKYPKKGVKIIMIARQPQKPGLRLLPSKYAYSKLSVIHIIAAAVRSIFIVYVKI